MKLKYITLATVSVVALSACGNTQSEMKNETHEHKTEHAESEVRSLDVTLTLPENVEVGEETEIIANVTSNDEAVTDADHVMIEILKDDETVDEITVEHSENGDYITNYTFSEKGNYTVISHVDAFDLHSMPSEDLVLE